MIPLRSAALRSVSRACSANMNRLSATTSSLVSSNLNRSFASLSSLRVQPLRLSAPTTSPLQPQLTINSQQQQSRRFTVYSKARNSYFKRKLTSPKVPPTRETFLSPYSKRVIHSDKEKMIDGLRMRRFRLTDKKPPGQHTTAEWLLIAGIFLTPFIIWFILDHIFDFNGPSLGEQWEMAKVKLMAEAEERQRQRQEKRDALQRQMTEAATTTTTTTVELFN